MSWWDVSGKTCVAAYRFIGAADEAAALVNLANPGTYNLVRAVTPGGTYAFSSLTGLSGLNSGSYYVFGAGLFPVNDWTIILKVGDAAAASQQFIGSSDTAVSRSNGISLNNTGAYQAIYNWGSGAFGGVVENGVMALAGKAYYRDAVLKGTVSAGTGTCAYQFYLGCENWAGTPHGGVTVTKYHALAIYSATLDAAEVAAITTAMGFAAAVYNQSVSGAWTPAGALAKITNKSLGGAVTTAGTPAKSTSKSLLGTLTTEGVGAGVKHTGAVVSQAVAGILSFVGSLTGTRAGSITDMAATETLTAHMTATEATRT